MFASVFLPSSLDFLSTDTKDTLCSAQHSSLSEQPWKQHPAYKKGFFKSPREWRSAPLCECSSKCDFLWALWGWFPLNSFVPASYHLLKWAVLAALECSVLWNRSCTFICSTLCEQSCPISISDDDASVRHGSSASDSGWRLWSHLSAKLAFDSETKPVSYWEVINLESTSEIFTDL